MKKRPGGQGKKPPIMLPNLLIFGVLTAPQTPAETIRQAYAIYYWRRCRTWARRFLILGSFLFSPLPMLNDLLRWTRRLGPLVKKITGKSLFQQGLQQFYLAFFFAVDAENYYLQEFYERDGMERARHFIHKGAMKYGTYRLIGNYGKYLAREKEICSLGRKIDFVMFCQKKKLPVVPIWMEFTAKGDIHDLRFNEKRGELPEEDLFCKPNQDHEGEGAEIWFWEEDRGYKNPRGEVLTPHQLKERLLQLAALHHSGSYLVQPLILPHEDLSPFRLLATPTVRILTYIHVDGTIQVDRAMLRFSTRANGVVDNANAGGMVVPVHLPTGTLGEATDNGRDHPGNRWVVHPENQAPIKGRILPFWTEVQDLVKEAQAIFPHRLIIGWDVIITDDGPLLLEGNSQTGLCFLQRAHQTPLGQMGVGMAMAGYAREAMDVMYSGLLGGAPHALGKTVDLYRGSCMKRWLSWFLIKNRKAVALSISGEIQGVEYASWLSLRAQRQHLDGWVQETKRGTVEAVLKGRAVDVEEVVWACWVGPEGARVRQIDVMWYEDPVKTGFSVLQE